MTRDVDAAGRVVLYIRVNRAADAPTDSSAIDTQETIMRAFAAEHGWQIANVFKDVASGLAANRPGLEACLDAAEAGEFDTLLIRDATRISRRSPAAAETLIRLERAGARVVSANGDFDSQHPQNEMLPALLLAVGELDHRLMAERIRTGIRRANDRKRKHTTKPSSERRT